MLLVGEEKSSLHRFMKVFKQESSFAFKRGYKNSLWQRSYYDRVLRTEETLEEVAWYIINNPVREGLVDDYRSYGFSGSLLFDIKELGGRT
jgi:REP element-mobilizing transposase RayT